MTELDGWKSARRLPCKILEFREVSQLSSARSRHGWSIVDDLTWPSKVKGVSDYACLRKRRGVYARMVTSEYGLLCDHSTERAHIH
ncbi:hypothetical protein BT69DRAFT_1285044 [Atractiella rhizophila]|nr:hypothetical protein BT69DRAFT_1285044 [Atractiella rhizophila]